MSKTERLPWAEWRKEFARIFSDRIKDDSGLGAELAQTDMARDAWKDGDSPSDAVETELSYWGD